MAVIPKQDESDYVFDQPMKKWKMKDWWLFIKSLWKYPEYIHGDFWQIVESEVE